MTTEQYIEKNIDLNQIFEKHLEEGGEHEDEVELINQDMTVGGKKVKFNFRAISVMTEPPCKAKGDYPGEDAQFELQDIEIDVL